MKCLRCTTVKLKTHEKQTEWINLLSFNSPYIGFLPTLFLRYDKDNGGQYRDAISSKQAKDT